MEIGGYFEYDFGKEKFNKIFTKCQMFNLSRNALAHLVLSNEIKKIYIPYYLCSSIKNILIKYDVDVVEYCIDENFNMAEDLIIEDYSYLYFVNYFGKFSNKYITKLKKKYTNLIVDNVQALFQPPVKGVYTIYSFRKWIGVTDGALLVPQVNQVKYDLYDIDYSYVRTKRLFGKIEKSNQYFYEDYVRDEESYNIAPIMRMGKVTEKIVRCVDYKHVKSIRKKNWNFLDKRLSSINMIKIKSNSWFMYPFLCEKSNELRERLIENKVYCPTLWPECYESKDEKAKLFSKKLVFIPCDQRYKTSQLKFILKTIEDFYKER